MNAMVAAADVHTIATFRMSLEAKQRLQAYAKKARLSQGELLRRFIAELPTPSQRKKPTKVSVKIV